jgi:hypothetical protein
MVNKLKQERGHELGMKRTQNTKKDLPTSNLSVKRHQPLKWGNVPTKLTTHQMRIIKGFHEHGRL